MLNDAIHRWFLNLGWGEPSSSWLANAVGLICLLSLMWLANTLAKRVILRLVRGIVRRTSSDWDDVLLKCGVFTRLSHLAPALVVTTLKAHFFVRHEVLLELLRIGISVYFVLIVLLVIDAVLDATTQLYELKASMRGVPLKGFMQGAKLVIFLFGAILVLSIVWGRSPLYFLSGLGALTAVLLLLFRDALLGLVAGIQISVNRMVQVGDWIELPKYGADGDIIDVGLTTAKVRNWDKTITTIPTYALISEPVKNWRGMQESGGRRIKRCIQLDMQSFRFLDDALLNKLLTFTRLRPYLEDKRKEIDEHNAREGHDPNVLVNGRRLTNIGCFRAYITAYLRAHPKIHQDMTLLVRQLQPHDKGLPLEIYVFTNDTNWTVYEGVQADIFDHLLTVVPEFGLRVFQSPSGYDLHAAVSASRGASP